MLSSSLVLKPFYGKLAVFNRRVIHMEVSIPFGVALARYTNPQSVSAGPESRAHLSHLHVSPHTSFCADVRDHVFFNHWNPRHAQTRCMCQPRLAFAWGGDER
jgi:hypothetical protein